MGQDERAGTDVSADPAAGLAAGRTARDSAPGAAGASPGTTGDPRVDAAVGQLGRLPDSPVPAHAEIFERVHAELVDILGELDTSQADQARQAGAN